MGESSAGVAQFVWKYLVDWATFVIRFMCYQIVAWRASKHNANNGKPWKIYI